MARIQRAAASRYHMCFATDADALTVREVEIRVDSMRSIVEMAVNAESAARASDSAQKGRGKSYTLRDRLNSENTASSLDFPQRLP